MAKTTALEIEMLSMKSERMADANLLTKHKAGEIVLTPAQFAAIRRRTADRTARYDLIVTTLDHAEGRQMFYDARIYCPACGCSHSFQYSYESPGTGKGCLIPGNPYLEVYGIAERCEREFCGHIFTETELKAAARADMRARFSMAMAS